jgi:hypothetical protein
MPSFIYLGANIASLPLHPKEMHVTGRKLANNLALKTYISKS